MQVTEKKAERLVREYGIVVSAQDIGALVDERLEELKGQIKLPGFRPGKVPANLLKQRYGKSVLGEILEKAVNETSQKFLEERGLRPAMQPKIEVTAFDEGKDLEYSMEFEIVPAIEAMDFATLRLEKPVIAIEDNEVEEALSRIAANHKGTKPLKRKRKARLEDVVTIDFDGSVNGEKLPGMAGEDFRLELGSGMFIPGFEEQVVGAGIGDELTVTVTFPENYGNEKLSGKEAVFEVKVKNVEETAPAEIDDALAQKLGEADLEALKTRIREEIAEELNKLGRSLMKRDLLDKLAEAHDFDVPVGMVEEEFQKIWRQIEADREADRLDVEDKAKSEDELKEDYREIAVRRVRLGLLMSEVGTKNNVEVTQEEINQALMREVRNYPGQEKAVFEFYQSNPKALAGLGAPLFEEKVVDFIVDLAQVTEKSMTRDCLKKAMGAEGEVVEEKPKKKKPVEKETKEKEKDSQ